MTITARYASTCSTCHQSIQPGQRIEWTRGDPTVRHMSCETATSTAQAAPSAPIASAVTYETVGARVYVLGQTFAIRDAIKSAGGHWDAERKAWWIGATKRAELEAAIAVAKPVDQSSYWPSKCKQCGCVPNRRGWPRIYRSGVCSDCYRDERDEAEMGY